MNKRESCTKPIQELAAMQVPTAAEADRMIAALRRQFGRTLACWASDVLALRQAGLHRFGWPDDVRASGWRKAA